MKVGVGALALLLVLIDGRVALGEPDPPAAADPAARVKGSLEQAESAVRERDRNRAFFHIARYVGMALSGGFELESARLTAVLDALDIRSTAFLSPAYSRAFVDWFVESTYAQWAAPDEAVDEEGLRVVVAYGEHGGYAAWVTGHPVVQSWSMLGSREDGLAAKEGAGVPRTILHVVDGRRKPTLVLAGIEDGVVVKRLAEREIEAGGYVHSFYPPLFHDFDGDGRVELCLRYTILHRSGFRQQLDIFRIRSDSLEPFRSFEAGDEGVARVTAEGEVLVSRTFPSEEGMGHLLWDRTGFEAYRFRNNEWIRVREHTEPNVLHSREFEKYFVR